MPKKITSIKDKPIQLPFLKVQKTVLLTTKGYRATTSKMDKLHDNTVFHALINHTGLFKKIIEVEESIDKEGQITTELFEYEINNVLREVFNSKTETIVIAFLNSDKNPLHENIMENLLRTAGYGYIYSSHKTNEWSTS
jgi:N-methylhydantoinase A/oxoprolinase/acetone carboxylase beta subunit